MSDYLTGEVRMFSFERVPKDWVPCDGQLLPVGQYEQLASLLGTRYGGDGQQTVGLPDLRGKAAIQGQATEPYLTVMYCIAVNDYYHSSAQ
jgi:microcystin-dependent protein